MTTSKNGLVCNMNRQQEWQWTEEKGGLLCHPTSKGKQHEEEEEEVERQPYTNLPLIINISIYLIFNDNSSYLFTIMHP